MLVLNLDADVVAVGGRIDPLNSVPEAALPREVTRSGQRPVQGHARGPVVQGQLQ